MATRVQDLRAEFPFTDQWAYLNHAAYGPFSRRTAAALNAVTAAFTSPATIDFTAYAGTESRAREHVAALVGGVPERVAFVGSLAEAMSLAAAGIDWKAGDNVVIPRDEFPSVVYPFLNQERHGVEVRFVDKDERGFTDLGRIEAAMDGRTRALVLSHVEFMDGFRNDLHAIGALCRARDILSIVDGTQSIGALPIDFDASGIDVIGAHAYKWLMASFGLGVMHFSERAIERIHPAYAGRLSVQAGFEDLGYTLEWRAGAARYQTGGLNWLSLAAFNASADVVREADPAETQRHCRALTERLLDEVNAMGYQVTSCRDLEHRSQIVSFSAGDTDSDARVVALLEERNVAVSLRCKGVRVSPYFYNNDDDIDRLLESLPPR